RMERGRLDRELETTGLEALGSLTGAAPVRSRQRRPVPKRPDPVAVKRLEKARHEARESRRAAERAEREAEQAQRAAAAARERADRAAAALQRAEQAAKR